MKKNNWLFFLFVSLSLITCNSLPSQLELAKKAVVEYYYFNSIEYTSATLYINNRDSILNLIKILNHPNQTKPLYRKIVRKLASVSLHFIDNNGKDVGYFHINIDDPDNKGTVVAAFNKEIRSLRLSISVNNCLGDFLKRFGFQSGLDIVPPPNYPTNLVDSTKCE